MLQTFGGNDFDVKYTGIAKKQRNGISAECVTIERDAHKATLDWWIGGEDEISYS